MFKMGTSVRRLFYFSLLAAKKKAMFNKQDLWVGECVGRKKLKQIGAYHYFFTGDWRITVSSWYSLASGILLTS